MGHDPFSNNVVHMSDGIQNKTWTYVCILLVLQELGHMSSGILLATKARRRIILDGIPVYEPRNGRRILSCFEK